MNSSPQGIEVSLLDSADPRFRKQIHEAIKAYNNEVSPAHNAARSGGVDALDISVYDRDGRLIGGLIADTYWGWLAIEDFWLHEDYRLQGIGSQMLQKAEKEARRRGCRQAKLETFSFQARRFYEKHGYYIAGRLDDYPPGQSFFWMVKDLSAVS